jgi:hypothetical protein
MKTRAYSNATLCQNFKAIGEELSEILEPVQTNIYIFIYIDIEEEDIQCCASEISLSHL